MDFAADAVIDVVAPPPARSTPRAPETSGPSFDDHLDAATREEPRPPARSANESKDPEPTAPKTESAENNVEAEADGADDSAPCAAPPAPVAQPAPVLTLQFIDLEGGPEDTPPASTDTPEQMAAPSAPQPPLAPATRKQQAAAPQAPALASEETANAETGETSAPVVDGEDQGADPAQAAQAQTSQQQPAAPSPQLASQLAAQAPPQSAPMKSDAPPPEQQAQTAASITAPAARAPENGKSTQAKAVDAPEAKAGDEKPNKADAAAGAEKPQARGNAGTPNKNADAAPFVVTDAPSSSTPTQTAHASVLQVTTSPATAAQAQHAVLDQAAARTPPAGAQVSREIVRRFDGETTSFEMRLDPPELGRIEVRLEVSRDHRVTAVVAADSPQALTELARHARDLEQSLQAAGLQLADNGLSFDLRQSQDDAQGAGENGARGDKTSSDEAAVEAAPTVARPIGLERWRGVRVDVMV